MIRVPFINFVQFLRNVEDSNVVGKRLAMSGHYYWRVSDSFSLPLRFLFYIPCFLLAIVTMDLLYTFS